MVLYWPTEICYSGTFVFYWSAVQFEGSFLWTITDAPYSVSSRVLDAMGSLNLALSPRWTVLPLISPLQEDQRIRSLQQGLREERSIDRRVRSNELSSTTIGKRRPKEFRSTKSSPSYTSAESPPSFTLIESPSSRDSKKKLESIKITKILFRESFGEKTKKK